MITCEISLTHKTFNDPRHSAYKIVIAHKRPDKRNYYNARRLTLLVILDLSFVFNKVLHIVKGYV